MVGGMLIWGIGITGMTSRLRLARGLRLRPWRNIEPNMNKELLFASVGSLREIYRRQEFCMRPW
jgi:hypothetical protein